jgi:hypothetical protein
LTANEHSVERIHNPDGCFSSNLLSRHSFFAKSSVGKFILVLEVYLTDLNGSVGGMSTS